MEDILKQIINKVATFNGSYVLLAAYITRELGGNVEKACDLAYLLMDDLDRKIQEAIANDEE